MLVQRSFDDLGTALADVTFCVVDLETTGGSPGDSAITEVGAVKVCRGELVGTFHTLVDPGQPVPAFIRLLTGITDEMLIEAPAIEAVLPSFLEFVRNTVLVAHNARFDVSFLNAALERASYPALDNPVVDTAGLARKILADEVPNRRLETLARHLRCAHLPCHRAYSDALATVDVLHSLIERATGFGVTTLEDLVAVSRARLDGTFAKISLTDDLPRAPGVYRFLAPGGTTLYVGKASDIRSRVRSYFYGDERAKVRNLLRETEAIGFEVHATNLEAEVAEARAIAHEMPPYNRAGKRTGRWYVKASVGRTAKVALCRVPKDDGSAYLGPFWSAALARAALDGLRDALPIHRCARPDRCGGCAFSEMRRCTGVDRDAHAAQVQTVVDALASRPDLVLEPLARRMTALARMGRFEEAADVRDRGALLERALRSLLAARALVAAGEIRIRIAERELLIRGGRLDAPDHPRDVPAAGSFLAPDVTREAQLIASWLGRNASDVRIVACANGWAEPVGARPTARFRARGSSDRPDVAEVTRPADARPTSAVVS